MTTKPDNEARITPSSRTVRLDFSNSNGKPNTRQSVVIEVSRLIREGTVKDLTLENLHLLKEGGPITITLDTDDRDPLATARFLLEEAGINTRRGQTQVTTPVDEFPYQLGSAMFEFLRESGFFTPKGSEDKPVVTLHSDGTIHMQIFRNEFSRSDQLSWSSIKNLLEKAGFEVTEK